MSADLRLDRDVQVVLRRLRRLPKEYQKERKKLLRRAAKPVVAAVKGKVDTDNKRVHRRYLKNGQLAAVYHPGNLRRSIRTLSFKKSKDLFVGPRLGRRGSSHGVFKGNKVDGYYGHFVEFGTVKQKAQPYMRPGFTESRKASQRILITGAQSILRRYASRFRPG